MYSTNPNKYGNIFRSKAVWICDDKKKEDLDESLRRLQAAITGLLDVFLKFSGPFFKNSKQIFQDILSIFKRCKEIEKLMKSSFFNEPEISDLISEIKEELRKENTTKLAKHVATLYKYRNASQYDIKAETKSDGSEGKADVEISDKSSDSRTINSIHSNDLEAGARNNMHNCDSESAAPESDHGSASASRNINDLHDNETESSATSNDGDGFKEDESTREKLHKALIDYGTHIDDPILQIIFDTSLHLAVANSAKKKIETKGSSNKSENITEPDVNNAAGTRTSADKSLSETPISTANISDAKESGSVEGIVESAIMSVCSGDHDSSEVAALKHSAKRKVEEMCCNALGDSLGAQAMGSDIQNSGIESPSSPFVDSQSDSVIRTQDKAKSDTEKQSGDSAEKLELPTNHRTLCVRVCKALNTRLYHIQQEMNRKWLVFKFGCDENASDVELFEKMQAKMIESHEKHGKPLSLSDLPKLSVEKSETKTDKDDETAEVRNDEKSEKSDDKAKDAEMDSLEGADADSSVVENEDIHNEYSSGVLIIFVYKELII